MENQLYKYEFNSDVAEYLLRAVNAQQIRGEGQAKDLVAVLELLRNPLNKEDLEKETLENLKSKYESVTEKKKEEKK